MFWSGNFISSKDVNTLLKDENVTLIQLLEQEDILQECKAENKLLTQFLTKPEVLAELIDLITEEPPEVSDLTLQYRHSYMACEVLTSHLPTLTERLAAETALLNKLCDFVDREPPLNAILASYYSKTIGVLLEKTSFQDYCLYHIVCLQVMEHFRSRKEFLPNLFRHLCTSAIADTLRCFIGLNNMFSNLVAEWFEEHKFVESLIQVICGTYGLEPKPPLDLKSSNEKVEIVVNDSQENHVQEESDEDIQKRKLQNRLRMSAASHGRVLFCEFFQDDCSKEGIALPKSELRVWLRSELVSSSECLAKKALSEGALHAAGPALKALLLDAETRPLSEQCLAPFVPLLHLVVSEGDNVQSVLGAVSLLATLATSHNHDVANAMLAIGAVGSACKVALTKPNNSFFQNAVLEMVKNALENTLYADKYLHHLHTECDLINTWMDRFEENDKRQSNGLGRSADSGHITLLLLYVSEGQTKTGLFLGDRFHNFNTEQLQPRLSQYWWTPLGGVYPSRTLNEEPETNVNDAWNVEFEDTIHEEDGDVEPWGDTGPLEGHRVDDATWADFSKQQWSSDEDWTQFNSDAQAIENLGKYISQIEFEPSCEKTDNQNTTQINQSIQDLQSTVPLNTASVSNIEHEPNKTSIINQSALDNQSSNSGRSNVVLDDNGNEPVVQNIPETQGQIKAETQVQNVPENQGQNLLEAQGQNITETKITESDESIKNIDSTENVESIRNDESCQSEISIQNDESTQIDETDDDNVFQSADIESES